MEECIHGFLPNHTKHYELYHAHKETKALSLGVLAQGQTNNEGCGIWTQAVQLHRVYSYEPYTISILNTFFSTNF